MSFKKIFLTTLNITLFNCFFEVKPNKIMNISTVTMNFYLLDYENDEKSEAHFDLPKLTMCESTLMESYASKIN